MTKALVVYGTAGSRKEADKIAQTLMNERLAACVSIVPEISSRYWWKGRIEYDKELLLIIKTNAKSYKPLERRIRELHTASVSEILAVPVTSGNPSYLKWISAELA